MYTNNYCPLSYLQMVKLGAVEQRWAFQLELFDCEIKYHPGTTNRNDALFHLPVSPSLELCSGITVPPFIHAAATMEGETHSNSVVLSCVIDVSAVRTRAEFQALQVTDSIIG